MLTRSIARFASLLVLAALGGCAAEDEESVDSADNAVITGEDTLERPEIGAFWHGGSLCTGTLIRPNVVLTAAHCVPGSIVDASAATPAYEFDITTGDRAHHRYKVDRIRTLLTAEDVALGQAWRTQDIALLHLAEKVPEEIAHPVELASSYPVFGDRVGVFGYGCTSRTPGANNRRPGTGTKRKKEYTWTAGLQGAPAETQNVCPGDSGGALMDLRRNVVLGTNSGFVGGNDRFGDVARNYALIDAVLTEWAR